MPFPLIASALESVEANVFGKGKGGDKTGKERSLSPSPFNFEHHDDDAYQYPNLYDEANEMLQVSMMIYRYGRRTLDIFEL